MSNELPTSVCCSVVVLQFTKLDSPPDEVKTEIGTLIATVMAIKSFNSVARRLRC